MTETIYEYGSNTVMIVIQILGKFESNITVISLLDEGQGFIDRENACKFNSLFVHGLKNFEGISPLYAITTISSATYLPNSIFLDPVILKH